VTKSQRGGEVRREWNGEGALGLEGGVLAFLPRGPRVPSYATEFIWKAGATEDNFFIIHVSTVSLLLRLRDQ